MQPLEDLLKFLASYPAWAKATILLCVLVAAAIVTIVPRSIAAGQTQPKPEPEAVKLGPHLAITAITPVELPPNTKVRLIAFVNGTPFRFPGVGNVDWISLGSDIAPMTVRVPKASSYEIRFEMESSAKLDRSAAKHKSQEVVSISQPPMAKRYLIYPVVEEAKQFTHGSQISAAVFFELRE